MISRFLVFVCSLVLILNFAWAQEQGSEEFTPNSDGKIVIGNGSSLPEKKEEDPVKDMLALEKSFFGKYLNTAMKQAIAKLLKENPFSKMSEEEVKSMIKVRFEGKAFGKIIQEKPNVLNGLTEWIRDEKAIPSLFGVLNQPKKFKKYTIIFFTVFAITFLLGLKNSSNGIFKRLIYKIVITFGALTVNLGAFYIIFQEEVAPTVKIILKHL